MLFSNPICKLNFRYRYSCSNSFEYSPNCVFANIFEFQYIIAFRHLSIPTLCHSKCTSTDRYRVVFPTRDRQGMIAVTWFPELAQIMTTGTSTSVLVHYRGQTTLLPFDFAFESLFRIGGLTFEGSICTRRFGLFFPFLLYLNDVFVLRRSKVRIIFKSTLGFVEVDQSFVLFRNYLALYVDQVRKTVVI